MNRILIPVVGVLCFFLASAPALGAERFPLSGKRAPDFKLKLIDGKTFNLSEQKGKVVVIDFWATWCGPCMAALPHMKKLQDKFAGKNLVILGISRDQAGDKAKVKKAMAEKKLGYACGIDVENIAAKYHVRGIPCIVLIDHNGVVQGRRVGFSPEGAGELEKEVKMLLAGKSLESAKPMTAQEIKDAKAEEIRMNRPQPMTTELNRKVFKEIWAAETATKAGNQTNPMLKVGVRIPPGAWTHGSGKVLQVVDPATGKITRRIQIPKALREANEMKQPPRYFWLVDGKNSRCIAVQQFYELKKSGTGSQYHNRKTVIAAANEWGDTVWSMELSNREYLNGVDVIPVGKDKSLLMLNLWQRFMLIDAAGKTVVDQPIAWTDSIEITDRDGDSVPEFTVIGTRMASYVLRTGKLK